MEDYDSQNIYENFSSLLYFKLKNHMSLFEAIRYIQCIARSQKIGIFDLISVSAKK